MKAISAAALTLLLAGWSPSEGELKMKYGHRSRASANCADVRAAVATYGFETTRTLAFQYGMTRKEYARALNCLGKRIDR